MGEEDSNSYHHLVVVTEGSNPEVVLPCFEIARQGAVFFWVRRHPRQGGLTSWYIKAFCSDGETLHNMDICLPHQITARLDGLWTAEFEDYQIHRILGRLFPLQYRRLHDPDKWPKRRGAHCFHSMVYVWGPLPVLGMAVVCLECFKVSQVAKLVISRIVEAMMAKRSPVVNIRTPVTTTGEVLVPASFR